MNPGRRPFIHHSAWDSRALGNSTLGLEHFPGLPPLGLPAPHDGRTSRMIDDQGSLFNSRDGAVHGGGGLQPSTPVSALSRSYCMRAGGATSCNVGGLVAQPVAPAEPLVQGCLKGKMAADPGDGDAFDDQGPKISVRPVEQLGQVMLAMRNRTVSHVHGVRN